MRNHLQYFRVHKKHPVFVNCYHLRLVLIHTYFLVIIHQIQEIGDGQNHLRGYQYFQMTKNLIIVEATQDQKEGLEVDHRRENIEGNVLVQDLHLGRRDLKAPQDDLLDQILYSFVNIKIVSEIS